MVEFNVVIGEPETGKTKQMKLTDELSRNLIDKKLNETINGDLVGLNGYELLITGGSDHAGFPMRKDIPVAGRKKILAGKSTGVKKLKQKNDKIRKTVCGNIIHNHISQINKKVVKKGDQPLFESQEESQEQSEESSQQ